MLEWGWGESIVGLIVGTVGVRMACAGHVRRVRGGSVTGGCAQHGEYGRLEVRVLVDSSVYRFAKAMCAKYKADWSRVCFYPTVCWGG